MKNVKLYEEFVEENIRGVAKTPEQRTRDKIQSLVKKSKALTKRNDDVANRAIKAKQKKTPEGNLELALTDNQTQQIKLDSQKVKLQQAEVKIKQELQKAKEVENKQKEIQQQQKAAKKEEPQKESMEIRPKVKLFEEFINEYNSVKGTEVWKHIKDITPYKEDIPNGFKKDIVGRKFKNVDDFDMKSLLKTDPDFAEYYKSGDERYDEDDVSPRDLSYEIVVVDGTLLDGYSRVSTLLRNGEKTTNAYVAESLLSEGVHDKNILKAIFMAGGPGSGKSRVAQELFDIPEGGLQSISYSTGLKVINSDQAFEYELQKIGIDPKNLATMTPAEFDAVTQGEGSPREKAKKITMNRQTLYMKGRLGMLIDGTGDDYKKIQTKKNLIEKLGYDTFMIFVNTSLEVALERNAARSRSLPEDLVKEIWQAVQNNIGHFQTLFGSENIIIIDNSLSGTAHIKQMEGAIAKLLRKPLQNRIGKQWVKSNL